MKENWELKCKAECPFKLQCGKYYAMEQEPCTTHINKTLGMLSESLEGDPQLDPERPLRSFRAPTIGTVVWKSEIPVNVDLTVPPLFSQSINFGRIIFGYVDFEAYHEEVIDRIKDKAPIIKSQF